MNEDVIIGHDGWLFIKHGSNDVCDYYMEENKFGSELVDSWHKLLTKRHETLTELGIQYIHVFVPNKMTIYNEYTGMVFANFNGHPIRTFLSGISKKDDVVYNKSIVDLIPFFNKIKNEVQLFWKTDTHWSFWGCFAAYQLICSRLGVQPLNELIRRSCTEGTIAMDLGSSFEPPIKEKVKFYNVIENSERIYANDLVIYKEENGLDNEPGLHVGSNVIFKNNKAPYNKKLVIFGDSFSEYRPHLLTALLAETFSEVHFVWSTSIDYNYVKNVRPDILITEIVERFMPKVPHDKFVLESHVKDTIARYLESQNLDDTQELDN